MLVQHHWQTAPQEVCTIRVIPGDLQVANTFLQFLYTIRKHHMGHVKPHNCTLPYKGVLQVIAMRLSVWLSRALQHAGLP